MEAVGIEEQATREIEATVEGARVTQVPCSSSHPVQLTSSHTDSSTSEHITAPATSSSFSMSQFMSLVPNSMPSLVHSPATPRRSLELQPTYPTSGTFQPCQGDQWSPREPPSPVAIDNVCDTSSSMHDSHSISPPTLSCDLYRYPASLDSCPSTPFFQRRRCSSLLPTFLQPKNTRNERSRTSPSRATSTIERKGSMSPLKPHTLYPPPWTNQPGPDKRDEQGPKVPTSPGIPTADSDRSPSSTTPSTSSNNLSFPIALTPYSGGRTCYHSSTARRPCSSTPAYANDARGLGDSKDNAKVVGTEGQLTKEIEMVMEGEEVTKDDATRERVTMPARTSSASTASRPTSMTPHNSNPILSSTTPTSSSPPYHLASPCSTDSSLGSCRRQHNTQNRHSRALAARAFPTIELNGSASLLTPNTSYSPQNTDKPSPNAQDERIPPMVQWPGVPMVDNEQHTSSTLDITSTLTTQILSNHQPSDIVLDPLCPQSFEDHLNEAFAPLTCTLAAPCSSTLAQANDTKTLGNLKNDPKAVEVDELVTGELEIVDGGGVAVVTPYVHPHPAPLSSARAEAVGLITRTSSWSTVSQPSSTSSQPTSTAPHNFNPTFSSTSPTLSSPSYHFAPPFSSNSSLVSYHRQHSTQNERLKVPTSRVAPAIKPNGSASSLTPN